MLLSAYAKWLADANLLVRTVIEDAIAKNNWSNTEYAKQVGVSAIKIMSLRKGIIMIDALTVGELMKIGAYHKIDFMI